MNGKLLTILVGAALVLPVAYATHGSDDMPWDEQRFGQACPDGWSCDATPDDGQEFPPDAVTGHTVYASWILDRNVNADRFDNDTLGLPTDFAAIAGYFEFEENVKIRDEVARAIQRECVVWFNGKNLDQRPEDDFWGPDNSFPSDEDEEINTTHQPAYQDYDFDRDVENCEPKFDSDVEVTASNRAGHGRFAVAVEKGDCSPLDGSEFRYRAHLDFVDPNGVYHEVQEYDYVCAGKTSLFDGRIGAGPAHATTASAVKDFFPWTYSDQYNTEGCQVREHPGPSDVGGNDDTYFDLGHKCNGSVQDLFTERLWITPMHDPVQDPTIEQPYNFALQIDTCAGVNIYELNGKEAQGEHNNYSDAENMPGTSSINTGSATDPTTYLRNYHDVAYHTYYTSLGLDEFIGGWPLYDVCTDGSSFSFNDTPRGRVTHGGSPQNTNDPENRIMRGNSYDFDPNSDTYGKHRQNCRVQDIDWPMNTYPQGPPPQNDHCYPEDHKTAQVDIYVFDDDPTGQWDLHTKGDLTGPGAVYTQGTSTGSDGNPDDPPGLEEEE